MHIIYKQAHETASYAKALQTGAVREDEMRAWHDAVSHSRSGVQTARCFSRHTGVHGRRVLHLSAGWLAAPVDGWIQQQEVTEVTGTAGLPIPQASFLPAELRGQFI